MRHDRLHALTDGIFAIVMTLLVLDLKIPALVHANNASVWQIVKSQSAVLLSYFISFITLFVYWRAHNFVVTFLAKNIDINLLTINGIFLFLVGLIPFTTQLAGSYSRVPLAVSFYALNIILIGLSLVGMRQYIERSDRIENAERTREQQISAYVRTWLPISFAAAAILLSFVYTRLAFAVLLFGVLFNLYNNAADLTRKLTKPLWSLVRRDA